MHGVLLVLGEMFLLGEAVPGLALSPNAEVVHRLGPGQRVAVHVVHLHAVVADARDEGLGHT